MSNNPIDWQIAQLQTVAKQYGIRWRHDGGSHCVFITAKGQTLPVPPIVQLSQYTLKNS